MRPPQVQRTYLPSIRLLPNNERRKRCTFQGIRQEVLRVRTNGHTPSAYQCLGLIKTNVRLLVNSISGTCHRKPARLAVFG